MKTHFEIGHFMLAGTNLKVSNSRRDRCKLRFKKDYLR